MKICIGIPSGGSESTLFSTLLFNVYKDLVEEGYKVEILKVIAPYICRNRNDLVEGARACGADYLMFLDNDMLIPGDVVRRLLARGKDVVGGNYVTKTIPARYMASRDGEYVRTVGGSGGLEVVDRLPTGCMLVKMDVFDRVKKPYFFVPPRRGDVYSEVEVGDRVREPDVSKYGMHIMHEFLLREYGWNVFTNDGGEDYWFCNLCKEAGIEMWVDHDLSKVISHMGIYPYSVVDACRLDEYTKSRYGFMEGLELKRGDGGERI